jgi:hypothetical protein|tara:strand:- start:210 stop:440 length:231 start_codon:yes stop_codon:yes gene_type:complete
MSREELKRLFLTFPKVEIPVKKEIIVQTDYGHVEILSDGPSGYSSFKTNQGDECVEYARNSKEFQSGKYKLIINKR